MKKLYTTFITVITIVQFSYAQWTGVAPGPISYTGSNVSIGTTNTGWGIFQVKGSSTSNPAIATITPGAAQGELSDITFYSTFQGTGDNGPRRTADILAGFNSAWGGEYLTFNIGRNGVQNDVSAVTLEKMRILGNGNVGIGTATPSAALDVAGLVQIAGVSGTTPPSGLSYGLFGYGNVGLGIYSGATSPTQGIGIWTAPGGVKTEVMRILSGGNVLIGNTSQTNSNYRLDVYGSARANAIVVNTTGADFVFDNKYILPNLSEVKSYIDQNHHLPEIPSAEEMKKNGMDVGDLNTKLLQKVEELTLYLIDKDKQLSEQQNLLKQQQEINKQLSDRITALEKANK